MPQFVEKLKTKAESITRRMGSPKNPESMMGPVISAKQLEGIVHLVEEAKFCGVEIVTGGERMFGIGLLDGTDFSKGYYYPPTIITGNSRASIVDTIIWKEEAFGPVIVVVPFKSEDEAVSLANDSEFGLGAAVWTQDLSQAFRVSDQIEAGICWGELSMIHLFYYFFIMLTSIVLQSIHITEMIHPPLGVEWVALVLEARMGKVRHLNPRACPVSAVLTRDVDAYYAYTTTKSTIINYATTEEGIKNDDWFRDGVGEVRYG
jgi:hypothetical protein